MAHDGLSVAAAAVEPGIADLPALIDQGKGISYADLARLVAHRQQELAAHGVGPGSRVTLRATCDVQTVVTFFALLELQAAFVPIHPRLTADEEQVIVDDVCPDVRLTTNGFDRSPFNPMQMFVEDDPPAAIVYTSGTTGRPKGAVLSRGAFVASALASEANLGWRSNDRWLVCMPLAHVGGLSILTRCLAARKPIVLEPRFDPDAVLHAIRREDVTLISVVPTMLDALLQADRDGDLQRLRLLLVGGAAASPVLLEKAADRGLLAITTYGLTEACSQVTCQALRASGTLEAGSGRVLPGIELRVVRDAGDPAATNEVGFIQVRGPNLMRGYWSGPEKPVVPSRTDDGWFATGDMGALDETGRLFVHARRTDLIVSGGENVYPAEVEQAFERCAGVKESVVFGVPDERWGQTVTVALVLRDPGSSPNERALAVIEDVAARLASHKRPRRFAVLAALPRNAAGKIDRISVCRDTTPILQIVPGK
ncbi:MAG TPA: AMP-binding protein [Polyangium sp.]|nr:AMP-binding protein [Polyangium sp.]